MADHLDCPKCNERMVSGGVQIHGSCMTFLLVGVSWQHLWFSREGKKQKILASSWSREGYPRKAFRCGNCGGVFILDEAAPP